MLVAKAADKHGDQKMEQQIGLGEEEIDLIENNTEEMPTIDINAMSSRKFGEKIEKPNLAGKTVVIENVELKMTKEEKKTKDGSRTYLPVLFKIEYTGGVYENYGGVSMFKRPDGKFSEPSIWTDGKSAAAKLFNLWLDFKGKKVEEVSLKDFFQDIKGKQVQLKNVNVSFQGDEFNKNVIEKFIK